MSVESYNDKGFEERLGIINGVRDRVAKEHGLNENEINSLMQFIADNGPTVSSAEREKNSGLLQANNPDMWNAYHDFMIYMGDAIK